MKIVVLVALFISVVFAQSDSFYWSSADTSLTTYCQFLRTDGFHRAENMYAYIDPFQYWTYDMMGIPMLFIMDDLASHIQDNFCYAYYFLNSECAGAPVAADGYMHDVWILYYYFDVPSFFFINVAPDDTYDALVRSWACPVGLPGPLRMDISYDSSYNMDPCYDIPSNGLPPRIPVGCTDSRFTPMLSMPQILYCAGGSFTPGSVLVVCDNELPCAIHCTGEDCGFPDECGLCVGACDDGFYCNILGDRASCEPEQVGHIDMFWASAPSWFSYGGGPAPAKRDNIFQSSPMSHFENVLAQDVASLFDIPKESVVINNIEFLTLSGIVNVNFRINLDKVTTVISDTIVQQFLNEFASILNEHFAALDSYDSDIDPLDSYGPISSYLVQYFMEGSDGTIISGSTSVGSSDEWQSFTIPSEWLYSSSASAVAVGFVSVVLAILSLLA